MCLLAIVLACLTARELPRWATDDALWSSAAHVAPLRPRPLINLAVSRLAGQDFTGADRYLTAALALVSFQTPTEAAWTRDLIQTNSAKVRLGQGRFREAQALLTGAPPSSRRAALCRQLPTVCPG